MSNFRGLIWIWIFVYMNIDMHRYSGKKFYLTLTNRIRLSLERCHADDVQDIINKGNRRERNEISLKNLKETDYSLIQQLGVQLHFTRGPCNYICH